MNTLIVPANVPWHNFPNETWKYELVLNFLVVASEYQKYDDSANSYDRYRINISAEIWRSMIGSDYKRVLDRLEEFGIVKRGTSWQGSVFPKDIWLQPTYRNKQELIPLSNETSYRMKSFQKRRFASLSDRVSKNSGIPKSIYEYLQTIIQERTSISATQNELAECATLCKYDTSGAVIKKVRPYDMTILENISHQTQLFCRPGDLSYRLFSPITQMCSVCRGFLRTNANEELWEIDVQCSQPSFLLMSAIKEYGDKTPFESWIWEIENGDLYERLAKGIGVTSREELKANYLFRTLYGRVLETDVLYQFIKKDCPKFAEYIFTKKNGYSSKKEDYAKLAIAAQQTEALFILGNVVRQVIEINPSAFLITIHDSIITTQENVKCVAEIMKREFAEMGIQPVLKTKTLCYHDMKIGWENSHYQKA